MDKILFDILYIYDKYLPSPAAVFILVKIKKEFICDTIFPSLIPFFSKVDAEGSYELAWPNLFLTILWLLLHS